MIKLIIFLFISSISLFLFEDNQNQQKPIKQLTYKIIKPTKYYALSFGGGGRNFWDATHRITSQLKQTKLFTYIYSFTEEDLKKYPDFWNKHKIFIENHKRGYGYWIWKAFLVLKTLEKLKDNDILLYLDSGCTISDSPDASQKLKLLIEKCKRVDFLFKMQPGLKEKSYTKMDLLDFMGHNNTHLNTGQLQSGILFIKKTQKNVDLVKEWYSIMSQNYHLIDDSHSVSQNDPEYLAHRHDQSVLSLLVKTERYDYFRPEHIVKFTYPILLTRTRHG
jgi:hypothetical protein